MKFTYPLWPSAGSLQILRSIKRVFPFGFKFFTVSLSLFFLLGQRLFGASTIASFRSGNEEKQTFSIELASDFQRTCTTTSIIIIVSAAAVIIIIIRTPNSQLLAKVFFVLLHSTRKWLQITLLFGPGPTKQPLNTKHSLRLLSCAFCGDLFSSCACCYDFFTFASFRAVSRHLFALQLLLLATI